MGRNPCARRRALCDRTLSRELLRLMELAICDISWVTCNLPQSGQYGKLGITILPDERYRLARATSRAIGSR